MQKHILFLMLPLLLFGCKKKEDSFQEFTYPNYGTVTGTLSKTTSSSAILGDPNLELDLNIMSIGVIPMNGGGSELRMVAWNELAGSEYRQLTIVLQSVGSFSSGQSYPAQIYYHEGIGQTKENLHSTVPFVEYTYAFFDADHVMDTSALVTLSSINLTGEATSRSCSFSISEVTFDNDLTIQNLSVNATSFGKMSILKTENTLSFDCNGTPNGLTGNTVTLFPKQAPYKRGINEFTCEFPNDGVNQLQSIHFKFTHQGDNLAYNGRVGAQTLIDGTQTNIEITATTHSGEIYSEQKDAGFFKSDYEKLWVNTGFTYYPGRIYFEFGCELKSPGGNLLNISNGIGQIDVHQ